MRSSHGFMEYPCILGGLLIVLWDLLLVLRSSCGFFQVSWFFGSCHVLFQGHVMYFGGLLMVVWGLLMVLWGLCVLFGGLLGVFGVSL